MKPIKIEDTAAIEAALAAINGRAESFTITSAAQVAKIAEQAEQALANSLTKAARAGARVSYTPAGPSAKSYKRAAVSTTIGLERRAAGWVLIAIDRTEVFPRSPSRLHIALSPEQHMAAAIRAVSEVQATFIREARAQAGSAHADLVFIQAAAKKAGISNAETIAQALLPLYAR
jgi:hypothetical protein